MTTSPVLRVVKGDATPEEVAALVAVIASMGAAAPAEPKPRSAWADPARRMRSRASGTAGRLARLRPPALMRTDAHAVRVLCFGDSNTHGTPADDPEYVRLGPDVRWTGRLQRLLGDEYEVIEEGLSGRTTDVDYVDRPHCNGRTYFPAALMSHHPLDFVVVMLGSNDFKTCFGRSAPTIADALHGYVDDVETYVTDQDGPHAADPAAEPDPARRQHHGVRRPDRQRLRRPQPGRVPGARRRRSSGWPRSAACCSPTPRRSRGRAATPCT